MCVFAPLRGCRALLAVVGRGELSPFFKQMERASPGRRDTRRADNTRTHAEHTHAQQISYVLEHQVANTQAPEK